MMYTPIRELVGKDLSNLWYIWEMDLNQRLLSVELDPQNVRQFIVSYSERGKKYTDKNVDGDRYAFRDNSEELERENKQLRAFVEEVIANSPAKRTQHTTSQEQFTLQIIGVKARALLASLDAERE